MPVCARLHRVSATSLAREVARLAASPRLHQLCDWFARHEREIADFQLAITAIPAPSLAEQQRAAWLASRLGSLGLQLASDDAGNLLAFRPADRPSPATGSAAPVLVISAHLDTVFPATTELKLGRENARLVGPGIGDNGAGLAALWALASALHECKLHIAAPLLFVANVGEEGEGNLRGMRHLYRNYFAPSADLAAPSIAAHIALDGAGCDSIIAQALGCRRFEVIFRGPGGHSWSDFGAPNPIVAAALAIAELQRLPLPVMPRTTLNIGLIEGGTSVNAIPQRASFRVDLRSSEAACLNPLERCLRSAVATARMEAASHALHSGEQLACEIRQLDVRPSGELSQSSPLLAAIRAVDAQLGLVAQIVRASTDANIPLSLGLEAVTLGAGGVGGGAHTLGEWYDPVNRALALRRIGLLIFLLAGLVPDAANGEADSTSADSFADSVESDAATPTRREPGKLLDLDAAELF